jgi:hypothetical protein
MEAECWLVWIHGARGPSPQKWTTQCFEAHPNRLQSVMARHPLSIAEARLTLDVLAKRYPPPAASNDAPQRG